MARARTQAPAGYPRNQRTALLFLLAIGALSLLLSSWWRSRRAARDYAPSEAFLATVAELEAQRASAATASLEPAAERFYFNPNTVSAAELIRLGLNERQAKSWLKYRGERTDAFRKPEDIGKLFVLNEEEKATLIELARVPSRAPRNAMTMPLYDPKVTAPPPAQRFPFDPNVVSADSLRLLGLTSRQAATLLKYRSYRPRTFRRAEDLYRVRALDSLLVGSLLAFVVIEPGTRPSGEAPRGSEDPADNNRAEKVIPRVDVNRADAAAWQGLPGIGAYRAEKIVAFREKLGGFVSIEQVATTYGVPDSTFQSILPYLDFSGGVRQIALNSATEEELYRHPYVNRKLAGVLVKYRARHGNFTGPADLANIRILDDKTREQIIPYLRFE